jgi:hypothetical protein
MARLRAGLHLLQLEFVLKVRGGGRGGRPGRPGRVQHRPGHRPRLAGGRLDEQQFFFDPHAAQLHPPRMPAGRPPRAAETRP